jgi:hypothetical protein
MKTRILLTLLGLATLLTACTGITDRFTKPGLVEQIRAPHTNQDGSVTPGVNYTNRELPQAFVNGVQLGDQAASAAGIPWAHTAATALLGLGSLAIGWVNMVGHKKVLAALQDAPSGTAPPAKL